MRFHRTLLLATAAAVTAVGGTAHAAGTDFQYVGTDDKVHALHHPAGCYAASGGRGQGVVNQSDRWAVLYATADCTGTPVARVAPGAVGQISRGFRSVDFPVTG
ncbi:hypothetical protein [Streptomyces sp. NPDC097619]|uniref:hypothetical protein n=1 Tax=Streptomyces sp. NPDC097619 TaxID=3157228 RepID=UPI003328AFAA